MGKFHESASFIGAAQEIMEESLTQSVSGGPKQRLSWVSEFRVKREPLNYVVCLQYSTPKSLTRKRCVRVCFLLELI